MAATLLSGAAFGAAMLAAGFHHPSVVISQLKFDNFHMFQAFLTATATSAVVYNVAERLGYVTLSPRSNSPLGLFAAYDGNILGGALLGAGMALSGSCPGTLLAQGGAGVRSGFYSLGGAVLGGIIWTGFLAKAIKKRKDSAALKTDAATLDDQLGLSRPSTLVLVETAFISIIVATTLYTPQAPEPKILGAVGGLLIGSAQIFSIVTRKTMMGISGSYEEAGNYFWWLVRGGSVDSRPRSCQNSIFATGVFAGAWGLAHAVPVLVDSAVTEVSPLLATLGSAIMIIGSRMAGGCTSGHGISGISLLSMSSIVTIGSAFGAGAVVASSVY